MPAPAKLEFLDAANRYLASLKETSSFEQIVKKWRETNIPYCLDSRDPHSIAYRDEVLDLYKSLTGCQYDVMNEWTSTLQGPEEFEKGYPWVSNNLMVISEEIAKPIQVMRALHGLGKERPRVIEFGSGWGNLGIPLAKSGVDMTLVDIDQGFLDRAERIAARESIEVKTICGDFLEAALRQHEKFDVAVFQSAFHHCLEFQELLVAIRDNVIREDGSVLFVNEPITPELNFPWGLRYDGESLWAIMCNKWLELGFHSDFFSELLLRTGFLPQEVPGVPSLLGSGWKGVRGHDLQPLASVRLPQHASESFHEADAAGPGRFCRARSILPRVGGSGMTGWRVAFTNYSLESLEFHIHDSKGVNRLRLASGEAVTSSCEARNGELVIDSKTFVPSDQGSSADSRVLGIYVSSVSLF